MIQFANAHTAPLVRQMWKICFEDTEEFMDIYFSKKYKEENTLIYFEGDEAVASLQMLPYTINFYGENIPFAYLAGLCTLPKYRQRGYMAQLIHEAHKIIEERNIPLSILIPAEDWLYGFYEKYGYEQVFEKDNILIPINDILNKYKDTAEAYQVFDALFRDKDFCIQKSYSDFEAIVEEYISDGCPPKTNLSGMARVMDAETLLSIYAKANSSKEFSLRIEGDDYIYRIQDGNIAREANGTFDFEFDIHLLCRLLFGYKLDKLEKGYRLYFTEHSPIMNLMLE